MSSQHRPRRWLPLPAQHFPLVPLGGEPQQKGFVEVIHPGGPQAAVFVTNASGNGEADGVFDPALVAALGLRGLTIGGNVTLVRGRPVSGARAAPARLPFATTASRIPA